MAGHRHRLSRLSRLPAHAVHGPALRLVLLAAVPLLVLAVFFVLPVGGMVARGLWPEGRFDPSGALATLGRPRVGRVVWFTVWSAAAGTAVAVLLGMPAAYVLHRLRFRGQRLLRALVMVPFVLPTVVVGVAFAQVFGERGPLGFLGLDGSALSIVAALAFFNISVVVRTVGGHWQALDPRQEEAAAALGASGRQVFRTVTLPALLPAIGAAASVVFLFCATAFGVVLTMGGLRYANVETEIYLLTTQELDLQGAAALSIVQLLIIVALLAGIGRIRLREQGGDRTVPGRRPRAADLPLLVLTTLVLGFLMVPMVSLALASVSGEHGWSLGYYRLLMSDRGGRLVVPVSTALANSLTVAVQASVLALALGMVVAYVVSRRPSGRLARRLVRLFDGAFMLPLGVSAVTLGFGFLITLDRPPLDLRSSAVLVPIAQAMVALPLVVRTVAPVLASVDDRQRQAAASLGAAGWRSFCTVELPVAWRPMLAAVGFAFAVSLGEFGATSFLARSDRPTLPVVIYRLLGQPGLDNFGTAMAASVVLATATALVALVVERLRPPAMGAF